MKILFLGYEQNKIIDFLKKNNEVVITSKKINSHYVSNFDFIISYGYSHILSEEIINSCKNGIINLHISYLPYNRGSHPNFWSFIDNTKKGVSVHFMDKGIDTGDILFQKEIFFDSCDDTYEKTYNVLRGEIENLFIDKWENIISNNYDRIRQIKKGTFHLKKDIKKYVLKDGWKTKIGDEVKKRRTDLEIINDVEKVRTKNNVNWMDILRLAFKHAPSDAKKLMKKINSHDTKISELLSELSEDSA